MKALMTVVVLLPIIGYGQQTDELTRNLERMRDDAKAKLDAAGSLLEFKQRLDAAIVKRSDLLARLVEADQKLAVRQQDRDEIRERYREMAWSRAVGQTYARLVTPAGKVYEDVKITKVSAKGISILHGTGGLRDLTAEDLPEDLLFELDIDSEESAAAKEKEASAELQRLEAIAKALVETGAPDDLQGAAGAGQGGTPPKGGQAKEKPPENGWINPEFEGSGRGYKTIKFNVGANCPATLTIYRVFGPEGPTVRLPVPANKWIGPVYRVEARYSCCLRSSTGRRLKFADWNTKPDKGSTIHVE